MRKRVDYVSGPKGGNGGGGLLVGEEGEGENTTVVLSENTQQIEEHIQKTIADRVAARLTERLSSMALEERANARGLLRLHQQGRLEEYFKEVFAGGATDAAIAQVEEESGVDLQDQTFSFLVSRPLYSPPFNIASSHMFIVTNARYLGDPDATIISYGKNEDGNVGRLYDSTYTNDLGAWRLLEQEFNPTGIARIEFQIISATSSTVLEIADRLIEHDEYNILGSNSNSAAQAIANLASGSVVETPGLNNRNAPGYEHFEDIDFSNEHLK